MSWSRVARARIRRGRRMLAVAAALLILMLSAIFILIDREAELSRARAQVAQRAVAVAEHVGAFIQLLDLVLDLTMAQLPRQDLAQARNDPALHEHLADVRTRVAGIESLFVVDGDGRLLASSRVFPVPPYDMREREYVRAHRDGHDGLYVSEPARGHLSRTVNFIVSRPILVGGASAGIIAVSIFPQALGDTLSRMFGSDPVLIARRDGAVLLRTGSARPLDRLPERNEILRQVAQADAEAFTGTSLTDGERAVHAVRQLAGSDIVVAVARRQSDILSSWQTRAFCVAAFAAMATGGLAVLAGAGTRRRSKAGTLPLPEDARVPADPPLLEVLARRLRLALAADDRAGAREIAGWMEAAVAPLGRVREESTPDTLKVVEGVIGFARACGLPEVGLHEPHQGPPLSVRLGSDKLAVAMLEVILHMSRALPGMQRIGVSCHTSRLAAGEVAGLPEAVYACISFAALAEDMAHADFPVASFMAQAAGGGLVELPGAGLWRVELWVPV